ncbi:GTPase-activator protein [Histomonas meleagridis]|uniref:GTPase-activator protein n=1 Tax=Histomonas meleagridis TaxID=135588 RepID=UPI003559727C|nr:GTPase-activator protein [Histomonas meleagridis]KAH0796222.1 GTPase-activator protein [Histomonas meleagridis]
MDPLEEIILHFNSMVEKHPATEASVMGSKEVTPENYLDNYFSKELFVLKHFSEFRIDSILPLFLTQTENILKNNNAKEWRFQTIFTLSLYYCLAEQCCKAFQTAKQGKSDTDATEESTNRFVINQANVIFGNEFSGYAKYLRKYFKIFLTTVGSISNELYRRFCYDLISAVSSKTFSVHLMPFKYLAGSVKRIDSLIDELLHVIQSIPKKKRTDFCEIIRDSIIFACKKDTPSFIQFLENNQNLTKASIFFSHIDDWNKNSKNVKVSFLSAQMALFILQPARFRGCQETFVDKLLKFNDLKGTTKDAAFTTILYGFKFLMLSHNNHALNEFMKPFYNMMLNYFIQGKHSILGNTLSSIDFAACAFYYDSTYFAEKIIPTFINGKNEGILSFSKIVCNILRQISQIYNMSQIEHLKIDDLQVFAPTILTIFEKAVSDQQRATYIIPLLKGFRSYPSFFRNLVFTQEQFLNYYTDIIKKHIDFPLQYPLLGFFDNSSFDITEHSDSLWKSVKSILDFLLKFYQTTAVYKPSQFSNGVPEIFLSAANFIHSFFQMPNARIIPEQNLKDIYSVVSDLESISLMFFASSRKEIRNIAKIILSNLVEIVDTNLPDLVFPVSVYQTLITEVRKIPILTTGHQCIRNSLRTLPTSSEGIKIAFDGLLSYFKALTNKINPNLAKPKANDQTLPLTIEKATDEWIGVSSVLYSLISPDEKTQLYLLTKELISDPGDLGQIIVAAIPTSIHVNHFMPFITFLSTWIFAIRNEQGSIEQSQQNLTIFRNIMKIFRGILIQKLWDSQMIITNTFSDISTQLVSFCDMVTGEEFRLSCAQCLIALNNLLKENDVYLSPNIRNSISKTLIGWLPSSGEPSKQYILAVQSALASMLDNLNLLDCIDSSLPTPAKEQASSLFMFYFVAIKSRLDAVNDQNVIELVPVLASLLKQNMDIGMEHCLSMGFAEKDKVRAVFMSALASVFKVPEAKIVEADKYQNVDLIDLLFEGDLELIEFVSGIIPFSRAEIFGTALLNAAIYKKCQDKLLSKMIEIELRNVEESTKTTLFRGNSVPSRVVGQYPRIVGKRYTIEPRKLSPGENIEENRLNFKNLLNEIIESVIQSSKELPIGIIEEIQLIYKMVHEKYGDFVYQILNGFFFLRFLLPTFTNPKFIGLPETLPEPSRTVLLQTSSFLMAATLKGDLGDKGADYQIFNDIANKAHESFLKMFKHIIEIEITEPDQSIPVNEITARKTLHAEIWPVQQQLANAANEMSDDSTLKNSIEGLLSKIQSMGQPKETIRPRCSTVSNVRDSASSKLSSLLNMKFTDDQLQQVSGFLVHETHNANDGTSIIYLYTSKIGMITDPTIVAYVVMKALNEESGSKVTMVIFLDSFDETKIPTAQMIKTFSEMKPALKITRYIFFEPNQAFANFVSRNQNLLFDRQYRFYFIKDLMEFNEALGPPSEHIPISTLESLTKPDSVYTAIVNEKKTTVQLHQRSIQFVGEVEHYKAFEFATRKVLLTKDIDKYTRPHESTSKAGYHEFLIGTTMKHLFTFLQPANSTLYEAILNVTQRSLTLDNLKDKVKIDSSTLQWLMLNLSFINMINDQVSNHLKKAAIDLTHVVYTSFSFKHNVKVFKAPKEALPENLLGYVKSLAYDVADNNPKSYYDFLTEYFNTYEYIEEQIKPISFIYLEHWIKHWVNDIQSHPELIDKFLDIYKSLSKVSIIFSYSIWNQFSGNQKALELLFENIFNRNDEALIEIIISLAALNKSEISKIWLNMLQRCIEKVDEKIIFVANIISSLLVNHLFADEYMNDLVFYISNLRLLYQPQVLTNLTTLFSNLIHELIIKSKQRHDIDYPKVCEMFSSSDISQSKPIALLFKELISDKESLFNKCMKNIDSTEDISQICNSLIFAAAFSQTENEKFINKAIKIIKDYKDETILSLVCEALSMITVNNEVIISKLYFIGVSILLYLKHSSPLHLISSTISKLKKKSRINKIISSKALDLIVKYSGLPFHKKPIFSTLMLFSAYSDSVDLLPALKAIVQNENERVAMVFSLLFKDKIDNMEELSFDFGERNGTMAAALILMLRFEPKSALKEYLLSWIEKDKDAFSCFDLCQSKNESAMLAGINNPYFVAKLICAQTGRKNAYKLAAILKSVIEGTEFGIDEDTLDELINEIYK